jgi:GxxExxY protein
MAEDVDGGWVGRPRVAFCLIGGVAGQFFGKVWRLTSATGMEPQITQITQMTESADEINDLAKRVIGCALVVAGTLGVGFVEKVYENALAHELRKKGLAVAQQHGVTVSYDGVVVGTYAADLLVEGAVLVELKAVRAFDAIHQAQCLNYLKATGLHLCLLLNFGKPRLEIKRIVQGL